MKDFKKLIKESYLGNPLNESVSPSTRIHYVASPAPRKMLVQELEDLFGDDYRNIVTEFQDDGGYESVLMFNLTDSDIERIEDEIGDVIVGEYSLKKVKEIQETLNEENEKWDKIAQMEYGKPWMELSIAQKQELLSYMNRETEKQFQTDYERRRRGDYSDDMEDGMTDYQRRRMDEEFKKGDKVTYLGNPAEITFVGKDQMDRTYYSVSYDKGNGKTKASNLYNKGGEIKAVKEDINDPALVRARAAQMKKDQRDREEAEYEAKQAALDKKYGSSFMDKLDAEIGLKQELQDLKDEREQLMMDMEQEAEPEGGEIADRYGSRLNDIDAKMALIKSELDDLRMYESVNEALPVIPGLSTMATGTKDSTEYVLVKPGKEKSYVRKISVNDYTKRPKQAARYKDKATASAKAKEFEKMHNVEVKVQAINEAEIPSFLTKNKAFKKAVDDSVNYNDFEKRVYHILGPKYFKLTLTQHPGVFKDYYDSIRDNKPKYPVDLNEESLQETLRKNLSNRLK